MYSYKLSKARDTDFFSAPHYDAISTALLKDGDLICVCRDCGELYLQSSWEANDNECCKCGCSARKDLSSKYFHRYKVQVQKVEKTRNRSSVTTEGRRNMVPIGTRNRPVQTITVTARRPTGATAGRTTTTVNNVNSSRQIIRPQPYPTTQKRRKKTGRILLGIVICVIITALIVGSIFLLDYFGILDVSILQAATSSFLHVGDTSELLSIGLMTNCLNRTVCFI